SSMMIDQPIDVFAGGRLFEVEIDRCVGLSAQADIAFAPDLQFVRSPALVGVMGTEIHPLRRGGGRKCRLTLGPRIFRSNRRRLRDANCGAQRRANNSHCRMAFAESK